jgi:prepilin peptidase CpaA
MTMDQSALMRTALTRDLNDEFKTRSVTTSAALLLILCVYASAGTKLLPALEWAGAFLFFAVESDLRLRKIPNLLTAIGFVGALTLAAHVGGLEGMGYALLGAAAIMLALFLPFALGALGAGDVKALMVLGALWGPHLAFSVLYWMILVGGALAIAKVVLAGELFDMLGRWVTSLELSVLHRRPTYVEPKAGSAAAGGVPFALAMVLGICSFQLWGNP